MKGPSSSPVPNIGSTERHPLYYTTSTHPDVHPPLWLIPPPGEGLPLSSLTPVALCLALKPAGSWPQSTKCLIGLTQLLFHPTELSGKRGSCASRSEHREKGNNKATQCLTREPEQNTHAWRILCAHPCSALGYWLSK